MSKPPSPLSSTQELFAVYRQLRTCDSVTDLLSRGADLARTTAGFDRGIVVRVEDATLTARGMAPLTDSASDQLRRTMLSSPVALRSRTPEGEIVRRPHAAQRPAQTAASPLAEALDLRHHAYAAIAPEGEALALLVVDRARRAVTTEDALLVEGLGVTLAIALEHVVLRTRAAQLADEVRQFAGSAQALAREVREAPTALPSEHGFGASFPVGGRRAPSLNELFSVRERGIAALVAEGRTNREIAEALVLSPETVKSHVSRILRKLGAANRVEAAGRYLRLAAAEDR